MERGEMATVGMMRRLRAMVAAWVVWGIAMAGAALAQGQDDLVRLSEEVSRLHRQGKYAQALPVAQRYIELARQQHGEEHMQFAMAIGWMALLYRGQGRLAEAEPLYKRGLAILEKALGPGHIAVGEISNSLAGLYHAQGRLAEAEPLYRRSLAIREQVLGAEHPDVGASLGVLAELYRARGRLAEAEPLHRRSLAITEKAFGPAHPFVGTSLNYLAGLYWTQGRYAEAEPLYKRSLAIVEEAMGPEHPELVGVLANMAAMYQDQGRLAEAERVSRRSVTIGEKALGPDHPHVGMALNNLAEVYRDQSRFADAEPLYRRSLAIREKVVGAEHPELATLLNNLAGLYQAQGRFAEAEPLFKRSLAIREKALGPEHPDAAQSLNNLAMLYQVQRRPAEAEPLSRRSLAISEKVLGPEHPQVGMALNNLALVYQEWGRFAEAERLSRRSLAIYEKGLGPEHPSVGGSLNNLALQYLAQDRLAEAEPFFRRSLAISQKALGPEHPGVAAALHNLAVLAVEQRDWGGAADHWQHSTGIIERRAEQGLAGAAQGTARGEAQRVGWHFAGLVRMTYRLAAEGRAPGTPAAEMFKTAQWAQGSEAAASLAQMAARSAAGSPGLAGLVREQQDLVGEWQAKDKLLIAAKSQEPGKRNASTEKVLADRLGAIDARLTDIGRKLARDFAEYAALSSPAPASVADVQAQLSADEALVLFLDTDYRFKALPEETFVWVVTRSEMRWVRSELGTAALAREVEALRCGLDHALWSDEYKRSRCVGLLNVQHDNDGANVLPFPVARAHALYKGLFGEVEDMIAGKHLLIVASGALTQLPFHVLVTAPPPSRQEHRAVSWLAREHAVTVLPSVSSLKALRRVGRPSAAPRPMIGFGNPLLDGPDAGFAEPARLAREKQRCPEALPQWRVTVRVGARAGVASVQSRAGLADLAHLRMQVPLPETAEELCAVALDVKAGAGDVRLGAQATEGEVKRMSASGELARYRMVHFATHGALAGQLTGTQEPGLILTPPERASNEDDGYLAASEIAALKLDADWVILSACNTAAGAATHAEALSGLARAFVYAGARALLVSHWAVNSEASVNLVTTAVGQMARNRSVGRAEAMRRAMLALIDKGRPEEAHPSYWSPFVVVGEGAAAR